MRSLSASWFFFWSCDLLNANHSSEKFAAWTTRFRLFGNCTHATILAFVSLIVKFLSRQNTIRLLFYFIYSKVQKRFSWKLSKWGRNCPCNLWMLCLNSWKKKGQLVIGGYCLISIQLQWIRSWASHISPLPRRFLTI